MEDSESNSEVGQQPANSEPEENDDIVNGDCDTPSIDTVSGFSSSASSPEHGEPFEPKFVVRVSHNVTKDGDAVKYTIVTKETGNILKEYSVQRVYEDFEWLEHCLTTSRNISGIIVPPLPARPAVTSQMAEAKSKVQLGNDTKTVQGDDFHRDCKALEKYLNLVLCHDQFGSDPQLVDFLCKTEAPARAKVKKGLFSKLSDAVETRKASHKDCDEFFQKERDWTNEYGNSIKEASDNFNKKVYSQLRLCNGLAHLATTLNLCLVSNEEIHVLANKLLCKFSEGLESAKHGLEVQSFNDENTLGFYLDLYTRYIESEKDMLFRRTCLMVDYENANKAMDKAKPNKRETAEQVKLDAEKAFEECTDVARHEIKKFHRKRVQMMREGLALYAEAQLKTACDTYAILASSLACLQQFPVPKPSSLEE